jgi:two-component system cell cycle response regulator DivK
VGHSRPFGAVPLVLVVDDSADTREVYAACLRNAGFRTEQADNGLTAVRKAREMSPAIVVLDYQMPVLDGLEAARRMKADPDTAAIPLILVSSFDLQGRDHCFDHSLTKPCSPEHLVAVLEASLAERGTPRHGA